MLVLQESPDQSDELDPQVFLACQDKRVRLVQVVPKVLRVFRGLEETQALLDPQELKG